MEWARGSVFKPRTCPTTERRRRGHYHLPIVMIAPALEGHGSKWTKPAPPSATTPFHAFTCAGTLVTSMTVYVDLLHEGDCPWVHSDRWLAAPAAHLRRKLLRSMRCQSQPAPENIFPILFLTEPVSIARETFDGYLQLRTVRLP